MSQFFSSADPGSVCPRWWRLVVIAISTLILCSCRATTSLPPSKTAVGVTVGDTLPEQAYTGYPGDGFTPDGWTEPKQVVALGGEAPLPEAIIGTWAPPGIETPWPRDEYLRDGGDRDIRANVGRGDQLNGLELEDTVVRYDTLAGLPVVEPSNRVHLYAPRFAAVRKVDDLVLYNQVEQTVGVIAPVKPLRQDDVQIASTTVQPEAPRGQVGLKHSTALLTKQGDGAMSRVDVPTPIKDQNLPYENAVAVKDRLVQQADKPYLADRAQAAIAWTRDSAVQIILESKQAIALIADQAAQETYVADVPGEPRLQVIKTASTQIAQPGTIVDFTIRYENVGSQTINNVAIVDNLTTRLEYVADTQQSSLKASFASQSNEGDSLILRWQLNDPLKPGQHGVVSFKCKVR